MTGRVAEAIAGRANDDRRWAHSPPLVDRVVRILVVAVAYYVAARFGLRLSLIEDNVTPLWPPTGIAVVAFLVLGRGVWPGVALAAFLVNAPISTSAAAAAATAVGNTLAPLAAATLLDRSGFHREIDRLRDAIAIVFLGALSSMLISASIGAGALAVSGNIPASRFPAAWAVWWTGDAMGVLVVAPFLLSLGLHRTRARASWNRRLEAAALFVILIALTAAVVRTDLRLLFLLLPFIGWAAWRFQLRGAAPAALIVTGISTWAAAHGVGPFGHGTLFEKMLTLQAFNATVAFTSFVFAALVSERINARHAVEEALRAEVEVAERLRRVDEMRMNLLSTVSHELRTPITISRGHLEVLGPTAEADEVRSATAVVLEELDRMGRIVVDLTSLVRMDDDEFLELEEVDLSRFVLDVAAKAEPLLGSRLRASPLPTFAAAKVDPQRLTQALINLLHNSAVHAPSASRVEIRLRDEPGWWRLEVDDDGGGLEPGSEDGVFEAFRKGPRSGGSGLGLTIVRGVAEAHGGLAGVDDRPGQGVTFWIMLPR